jgi:hypothetical protein
MKTNWDDFYLKPATYPLAVAQGIDLRDAYKKYHAHRGNCHVSHNKTDRRKNRILMKFSFDEWLMIWIESGHWHERGRHKDEYVMARKGDLGHYKKGNVDIVLSGTNSGEAPTHPEYHDTYVKSGYKGWKTRRERAARAS